MTENRIEEQRIEEDYQAIQSDIYDKQLKAALEKLILFLSTTSLWELHQEVEHTQISYNYMLQYMSQGIQDPDRKKLYNKLLINVLEIADKIKRERLSAISMHHYYQISAELRHFSIENLKNLRTELETYTENLAIANLIPQSNNTDAERIRKQHEEANKLLFEATWTNASWTPEEEREAILLLKSEQVTENDLGLFVSAVTLSLMEFFDFKKLMWLFNAYEHTSTQVSQRALVGLAFTFSLHYLRIELYAEAMARISLLNENEKFSKELNHVYIQWLRSQETDKIDKKMREEIIPEMLRSANQQGFKYGIEELEEDLDDQNPDWKQSKQSDLENKLREMSELQIEGSDVYMSTFSHLKSYPFFKTFSNWFYPFDKQHSEVVKEFNDSQRATSIIDLILDSGFFCDSDKYSLCFTMLHIPQEQRDMMLSQMSEQQMDELTDKQKTESMKKASKQPEVICNQYMHSLYRFFKIHPQRREFTPMFDINMELHALPVLHEIYQKPELLIELGDYHFNKKHFMKAGGLYAEAISYLGGDANLLQKVGYCLQKERRYKEAIEILQRADVIKPDNVWTNRHLATCYRLIEEYEQAAEYYQKVEKVQPENHQVLFYRGTCLAEMERYDEALNYFFKLDFIEQNCVKAWRGIGWCSFVLKKRAQALKYYTKVMENSPLWQDYINIGNVYWCEGNIPKTIEMYHLGKEKCLSNPDRDLSDFYNLMHEGEEHLIEQGINKDDFPLMSDLI